MTQSRNLLILLYKSAGFALKASGIAGFGAGGRLAGNLHQRLSVVIRILRDSFRIGCLLADGAGKGLHAFAHTGSRCGDDAVIVHMLTGSRQNHAVHHNFTAVCTVFVAAEAFLGTGRLLGA